MSKVRFVPLLTFSLFLMTCLGTHAQVLTDRVTLQNASRQMAREDKELQTRLVSLARQKGWSLTLHSRNGRMAYLIGVDTQGYPLYVTTTDNIISAATIGTSQLWPGGSTGLNLNGGSANMKSRIAVWDEGLVRPTHVELTGRVAQQDGNTTVSDHSTHVAGTLVAAGVNPRAKGMSFGAQQLLTYDFNNDKSEMAAAGANGLLVSSHSYATIAGWYYNDAQSRWEFWGASGDNVDYKFGYYDADAQKWDSIAYYAPNYLIVKAGGNNRSENGPAVGSNYWRYNASNVMSNAGNRPAGISSNDSYNIIATYGCSKNILTLGAVNPIPGGFSQPSDAVLATFSSWGPTGDGRIKPDVVADGVNVLSSIGTSDNSYDIYSGTSMATPAAAGSVFLLQEYYSQLHAGAFMRSATLKGLVIHTADETGASPGPDYQYGWGLIDMRKAASVITSDNSAGKDQFIQENVLTQGSHDVDDINVVASGKAPLVATIVWTDPTAPVGPHFDASLKLINDLDLRISDGTTTFKPWILDPANPSVAATTGDNIRDNVEKVEVGANLVPGKTYTITVNHKGTLTKGSQAYSLLVSGAGGTAYCTSASTGPGASIDNVTLANLTNVPPANTCRTYTDYTGLAAANLPVGTTIPISISHSSCNGTTANRVITVYIDFNNNGTFEAGEMVAQSTSTTPGGYNPTLTIPATPAVGAYARMRIIAEETASPAAVSPCGTYANGETQDYRVLFTAPPNDVGITALEYPTLTTCAYDSQLVVVRIRNFGTILQTSTPVTTVVRNGATTIATLTAICKDSIKPGSDVLFTFNTTFPSVAGAVYTFTSQTALAGDVNTSNDQNVTTLSVNAASPSAIGTAVICSPTGGTAGLHANTTGNDLALWYDSPTATVPVAAGNNTTTTVIPSNKTYYLGVNDLKAKLGPASKMTYANGNAGAYFSFRGNFIKFTTSVPLTLESAKMYIANPGKVQLILATNLTSTSTQISYIPVSTTTLDVYNTTLTAQPGNQINGNPATDTGATFFLNISIPVPGTYFIIINCLNGANVFLNTNITTNHYPITLPGVMSIVGNDAVASASGVDSAIAYQKFYYPFYNMGIRLAGCPAPRVPVVATTAVAPTITLNGNVFTSSASVGNQWYRSGTPVSGAVFQTDTAIYSGLYKTIVSDVNGCSLSSNEINFVSTGVTDINGTSIGLKVSPNPNPGVFQLDFTFDKKSDLSISLVNTLGQQVYTAAYPDFIGAFSQQINAGSLAAGIYVLKIQHGNDTYIKKILVKR